ncbi:hypothetical protein BD779DRAFT_1561378 [Infundibulicybe gibba]|nr:hypothetical protein BD779DRAFT_1561378 [Infundibulicybe gibba]
MVLFFFLRFSVSFHPYSPPLLFLGASGTFRVAIAITPRSLGSLSLSHQSNSHYLHCPLPSDSCSAEPSVSLHYFYPS